MDDAIARRYFHQCLLGVQYMHARGVTHRDLSLENTMLDGNDAVKLIDFGLSVEMPMWVFPPGGPLRAAR